MHFYYENYIIDLIVKNRDVQGGSAQTTLS